MSCSRFFFYLVMSCLLIRTVIFFYVFPIISPVLIYMLMETYKYVAHSLELLLSGWWSCVTKGGAIFTSFFFFFLQKSTYFNEPARMPFKILFKQAFTVPLLFFSFFSTFLPLLSFCFLLIVWKLKAIIFIIYKGLVIFFLATWH